LAFLPFLEGMAFIISYGFLVDCFLLSDFEKLPGAFYKYQIGTHADCVLTGGRFKQSAMHF
jgi:hypothetical protein